MSSPLLRIVFIERVSHFSSRTLADAALLAFVCSAWNDALQFYCLKLWERLFFAHLIDSGRDPTQKSRLYNLLCDDIIANKLSVLVSPVCNCGTGPNDASLLGSSALLCAATVGSVPIVKELLERGASLEKERNFFQENALHCAARGGHTELVEFIMMSSSAATIDINEMTKHGHTALFLAVTGNHTKTALSLLRNEKIKVSNGGKCEPMSTIHAAVRRDNVEILKEILKKDPQMIHHEQIDRTTPIEVAISAEAVDCFKILVEIIGVEEVKKNEKVVKMLLSSSNTSTEQENDEKLVLSEKKKEMRRCLSM